jgi:hypothetical protein
MTRLTHVPVLLLGGVLAACAQGADGVGTARDAGGRPTLQAAASRLPQDLAGFTRGATTWHERERAGMGVAMDYAGPARSAVSTVSLYDRGRPSVPDDIRSAVLQEEFNAAVGEALAIARTRTSQVLTESERAPLPVPGQAPLQCARLEGTYGRQEMQTLLCLGGATGRFLKVQVTTPARQLQPVDPLPFVVAVAQAARG